MQAIPRLQSLDAVLLDMDGTLVNSNAAVERCWAIWAEAHGVDVKRVVAGCHGNSSATTIRRYLPHLDDEEVARQVDEHHELECHDLAGVVAMPGGLELVDLLNGKGMRWAVATTAPRVLALARLHAAGYETPVLVGVDDVAEGKPAPDVYLEAARRCKAAPDRCLAVEDSAPGLESARRSGALVFHVGQEAGSLWDLVEAWRPAS